jgi:hypothetical protein
LARSHSCIVVSRQKRKFTGKREFFDVEYYFNRERAHLAAKETNDFAFESEVADAGFSSFSLLKILDADTHYYLGYKGLGNIKLATLRMEVQASYGCMKRQI